VHLTKEMMMNPTNKTRAAALVASILITVGMVSLVVGYAYPEAAIVLLASAER
jgi:hypothetical protein